MKFEDVVKRIIAIGTKGTVEEIRVELGNLQKDLEVDYKLHEDTSKERDNLKNDCETLRAANMKLFLQVGSDDHGKEDEGKQDPGSEDEKPLTYDNLFNDEGGLK